MKFSLPTKLDFLTSRKFWCLIAIVIVEVLKGQGIIDANFSGVLESFLYGYIGVNLVSKFNEAVAKPSALKE